MSGLWAVHCLDGADAAPRRAERLAEHSARLKALRASGSGPRLVAYGPLGPADGHVGSLFVVAADDRAAVEGFVADDPFARDGVWERVEVHPFRPSANSLVDLAAPPDPAGA